MSIQSMKQASICSLFLVLITPISECANIDKKQSATPAPYEEYGNEYGGYDISKWRKVMAGAGGVNQGKNKKKTVGIAVGKKSSKKIACPLCCYTGLYPCEQCPLVCHKDCVFGCTLKQLQVHVPSCFPFCGNNGKRHHKSPKTKPESIYFV